MKKNNILIIMAIVFLSCGRIKPLDKVQIIESKENIEEVVTYTSQFTQDNTGDLFEKMNWYAYDQDNHIIWSLFNIYSIKTKESFYKIQIVDYYEGSEKPGNYTLRVEKVNSDIKTYRFNAQGCGNMYTNPDFKLCMENPETNIYTYLNIETGKTWKMKDVEALKNKDWDLAFNGTSIKLNSGESGPGKTVGALVYYNKSFINNNEPKFEEISKVAYSHRGQKYFDKDVDIVNIPFFLPKGISRVINEPFWFQQRKDDPTLIEAKNENWWIVRSREGSTFSKFNVDNISEEYNEAGDIKTKITLKLSYLGEDDLQFSENIEFELDEIVYGITSSKRMRIKICIDLDTLKQVDCRKDKDNVDVIFSTSLRKGKRKFSFNTTNGAIGPLLEDETNSFDKSVLN